jgi:hypothetical protein
MEGSRKSERHYTRANVAPEVVVQMGIYDRVHLEVRKRHTHVPLINSRSD